MGMATENQWIDLQRKVDSHETPVERDAKEIATLKASVALIIEAFEKLDLYKFRGREHTKMGEAARDKFREIVKKLREAQSK
ncbi:MAG: hypothetical protein QOE73_1970 [Verrucomicrobiota bacterium]